MTSDYRNEKQWQFWGRLLIFLIIAGIGLPGMRISALIASAAALAMFSIYICLRAARLATQADLAMAAAGAFAIVAAFRAMS